MASKKKNEAKKDSGTSDVRAMEPLRESSDLFSLFMRHSPVFAYIKSVTPTESRLLYASDNYQRMLGAPKLDVAGKTMAELFPPEFAAKIVADDWAVVKNGSVLQVEKDMDDRSYISIKFPFAQGEKHMLAGYMFDITERKQAESNVHEAEMKLMESVDKLRKGEAKLREVEERQREEEGSLSELRDKMREAEGKLPGVESRLREVEDKLQRGEAKLREVDESLRDGDGMLKEYDGKLQQAESRLREVEDKAREREEKLRDGDSVLKEYDGKLREAENKLNEIEDKLRERGGKLQEGDDRLQKGGERLRDVEDRLREEEGKLRAAKDKLRESEGKLRGVEDKLRESEGKLRGFEEKLQAGDETLRTSEDRLREGEDRRWAGDEALRQVEEKLLAEKGRLSEEEDELRRGKEALQADREALRKEEEALRAGEDRLRRGEEALRKDREKPRVEKAAAPASHDDKELLQEINKQARNNIYSIIALMEIQRKMHGKTLGGLMTKPGLTDAAVSELGKRIEAIALLHERMSLSLDPSRVDLQDYLSTLVARARASMDVPPDLVCSVDATGIDMEIETAVPVGIIVNELVGNALKYAFPKNQPQFGADRCEIKVSMERRNNEYTLYVDDNGAGLPKMSDLSKRSTLGLRLIRMLGVDQLGGKLTVNRTKGTRFMLKFNVRE